MNYEQRRKNLILFFQEEASRINNYLDDDQLAEAIRLSFMPEAQEKPGLMLYAIGYAINAVIYRHGKGTANLLIKYRDEFEDTMSLVEILSTPDGIDIDIMARREAKASAGEVVRIM